MVDKLLPDGRGPYGLVRTQSPFLPRSETLSNRRTGRIHRPEQASDAGDPPVRRAGDTAARVLDAALASFGTRGYDGTSLDAVAAELGVTKQTILYYHPSKEALFDAVIDRGAAELTAWLEESLDRAEPGWGCVEAVVRTVFRLAIRRPELLGLVREVSRTGEPTARMAASLDPLVQRAVSFLETEMDAGRLRRSDPKLVLVSAYSTVIGVVTEVEVLRALHVEPSLRSAVSRRRELLAFLRAALAPES